MNRFKFPILIIIFLLLTTCRYTPPPPPSTPTPTVYTIMVPPEEIPIYVDAPQGSGCERLVKIKPAFITSNKIYFQSAVFGTSLGDKIINCAGKKDHSGNLMPDETLYQVVMPEHYGKLTEVTSKFWLPGSALRKFGK